jgi:hypothetical protein
MRVPGRVACLLALIVSAVFVRAQQTPLETWQFLPDPAASLTVATLPAAGWREARAGVSWQAQFADLRNYAGVAWYRTSVEVPRFDRARRVLLRFGAVDYLADVYVNGVRAGDHEGGYTPFVFDITANVHPGSNDVVVCVLDPPNKGEAGGIRYDEIPHGKQNWYVQTSGLWQPVTLEFRPPRYVETLRVTPQVDGAVAFDVRLAGTTASGGSLRMTVRDRHGSEVMAASLPVTAQRDYTATVRVASPEFWSPDDPALYTAEAALTGDLPDTVSARFGFRSLVARDGRMYLNGKPFYMIGALDQDFYPATIYSPPSAAYVHREMEAAKRLGLNTLRCHIKVCEPEYLDAADEAGIVVWYEIPNWDHYSAAAAQRGEQTLQEMVARDWNHPAILIQSIINESWGMDLKQAEQRRWLKSMHARARALTAPLGRLIVDNSPCCDNFHVRTDLNDFHQYFSIPDNTARWDQWVADFATRPKWTFSPYGDGEPTGGEPLILSEFGNWGLPQLPPALPWWFRRESGGEITQPGGVLDRFRQFGFGRVFPDYAALAAATQAHQFLSLKHEIEEIRSQPSIQGYVITEFTDLNWESNGLLDMWRNPKAYANELREIQQPDILFARLPRRNYYAGEQAQADVLVSHFSVRDLRGATVYWWTDTGARGEYAIEQTPNPASITATHISFTADRAAAPQQGPARERLFLELRAPSGELLAANAADIFVFPRPAPQPRPAIFAVADDPLAQALSRAGYDVRARAANAVVLARRLDDSLLVRVRDGARAVVLVDTKDALPAKFPVEALERTGDYDGNWISNFAWVQPGAAPFRDVAVTPILGWEAAQVTPHFVLRGVAPENYDDVLAGMFYGWLNLNSPLLVQARLGRGALLLTTFRFDHYGDDPFAAELLDGILEYVASPQFAPHMELRP